MIDHFLKWADVATAKADPVVQAYAPLIRDRSNGTSARLWLAERVIFPQVWRASQDTTSVGSKGETLVTHSYLAGFFVCIAWPTKINGLANAAAFQFAIDRDKANARQAGMIVASNLSAALMTDLRFQPVFAGADYPFGGM